MSLPRRIEDGLKRDFHLKSVRDLMASRTLTDVDSYRRINKENDTEAFGKFEYFDEQKGKFRYFWCWFANDKFNKLYWIQPVSEA